MRLRVSAATEKKIAANSSRFGSTSTTSAKRYGTSVNGPSLSFSIHGMRLPMMIASATPE
jgi:hypothetical protein